MHPLKNHITGNIYSHVHAKEFWDNYDPEHRLKVLKAKSEPTYKSKLKRIMNRLKATLSHDKAI